MENIVVRDKDEITMKLLHFFITREGYSPIIVHGAQEEIWLENMTAPYPIVRIMTGHIHNREQLEFDLYKANNLISRIKRKTFRFKVKTLSIFLDIGENVQLNNDQGIDCINLINTDDLNKDNIVSEAFPNISSEIMNGEGGMELFVKITEEINSTTEREAKKTEAVFQEKRPYITMAIIALNVIVFMLSMMYGIDAIGTIGGLYAPAVRNGQLYRLVTSTFIHGGAMHLFFNMYALYVIGSQLEGFYGRKKYLMIYFFSGLTGSLLSMSFLGEAWSVGASGAVFGLFGSLLYFGYHYRVYLGNALRSQIMPIILLNLFISFVIPGIDQFAHIGGLFGGLVMSMAVGVKHKIIKTDRINGIIISVLVFIFLLYIAFIYTANM